MTDAQWAVIEALLPVPDPAVGGRPRVHPRRLVLDSILYVLVTGCAWRQVPHDLVRWDVACRWFAAWTRDGTWARVHDRLREAVRAADGRAAQPSAAVLDSQSAKSAEGGEAVGYDAGKRVRGRKRHVLVDTGGLVLRAVVHSASVQDRAGARLVLAGLHQEFPDIALVWVDGGYVNVVDDSRSAGPDAARRWTWWRCRATLTCGVSRSCPAAGWSSGPSPGPGGADGWLGTTSAPPRTLRR